MDTRQNSRTTLYRSTFDRYANARFAGILLKGYHRDHNPGKDYKEAKKPIVTGFTAESYRPPTPDELVRHEGNLGWTGWRLPPEVMVIDNEDPDTMADIDRICRGTKPPTQKTTRGRQWTFTCNGDLRGGDGVYTRSGLKVTYRLPMKNYVIMPPTNGRMWEHEGDLERPPKIPDQLMPHRKDSADDLINCIAWEAHRLKNTDSWGRYEELQGLACFLLRIGIDVERVRQVFAVVFGKNYDPKKTGYFLTRDLERLEKGEPVLGPGTFFESVSTDSTRKLRDFALNLERLTGTAGKKPGRGKQEPAPTQAELLIDIGLRIHLFHDDTGEAYGELPCSAVKVRSTMFKQYLAREMWVTHGRAPNSDSLNQALNVLEAQANFEGEQRLLHNRTAEHDGAFWYDLADQNAVRISQGRWEVVSNPPLIFRRYPHQQPNVMPVSGGDLDSLFRFVNIPDDHHRLLLKVWLVSFFVPTIGHPIIHPHGDQGSGKTSLCRYVKRIIDPSKIDVFLHVADRNEVVQILEHHAFIAFDNMSDMPDWFSDLIAQAVTGAGFSKRKLYTDDEDIVYQIRRAIAVNGISQVIHRPDAMDRSILFRLKEIEDTQRIEEKRLESMFANARPLILGAAFDALAKAMAIYPTLRLGRLPRMADFCLWGCAIAEGMGIAKKDFLEAYASNIQDQHKEIVGGNTLAQAIIELMRDRMRWEGTMGKLYETLDGIANPQKKDRTFPKAANKLRQAIGRINLNLVKFGVRVDISDYDTKTGVPVTITYAPVHKDDEHTGTGRAREKTNDYHDNAHTPHGDHKNTSSWRDDEDDLGDFIPEEEGDLLKGELL